MRSINLTFIFVLTVTTMQCWCQDAVTTQFELWDVNSLSSIGGHSVTVSGNPVVVTDPDLGEAVKFDGNGDMLVVDASPIDTAGNFTVEVIFKPDGNNLNITNQPRFLCFWDPNDASSGPRITIEIRVNTDYKWYFDGFLKTDSFNLTLIDTAKTHNTNQWMHAALVYNNKALTTYVNGIQELTGIVNYDSIVLNPSGKVSIGARFNKKNWYSGLIKTVKITKSSLLPSEFITDMLIPNNLNITENSTEFKIYPIPAKHKLNIEPGNIQGNSPVIISIYSISGTKILSENFQMQSKNTISIDIKNLRNGLYLVNLKGPDFNFTQKLVVLQ